MTSVFSTIELPYWLLIAGTLFLLLGLSGPALRRDIEAKADMAASERNLFKPPVYESAEQFYDLVAKEKPNDRLAEKIDDPTELLLRWAGPPEFTSRN